MKKIIKQLGLQERTGHNGMNGAFVYFDCKTKKEIEFRWDGAAITTKGEVILLEEELCSISNLHIQGHLSRVIIMCGRGERVKKLVWIVNKENYPALKDITEAWITFLKPYTNIEFPQMEYRTPEGDLLLN